VGRIRVRVEKLGLGEYHFVVYDGALWEACPMLPPIFREVEPRCDDAGNASYRQMEMRTIELLKSGVDAC
jgi:hypothetical protein